MAEMRQTTGITAELRNLKVGEVFTLPCENRHSLIALAARMRRALARQGWDYKIEDDRDNYTTGIRRIH